MCLNGEKMVKFIIARDLMGKKVVSTSGYDLGRLVNVEISQVTGRINSVIVEPSADSSLAKKLVGDGGELKVSYSAVTAVADYIMVDTKNM